MGIIAKFTLNKGENPDWVCKSLKALSGEMDIRVFVLNRKPVRSYSQNRYYWGVVLRHLEEHTGIDKEDLHELMKHRFNLRTLDIGGKIYEFGGSTKGLDKKGFSEYIEKIRLWAEQEMGCRIPAPNEMDEEQILELINMGY